MEFWSAFWGVQLLVGLLIFAGVAVAVAIGGLFDIRSLFRSIDMQHRESSKTEDKEP